MNQILPLDPVHIQELLGAYYEWIVLAGNSTWLSSHASIQITLDTYSHVAREIQKAAEEGFDGLVSPKQNDIYENEPVEKYY